MRSTSPSLTASLLPAILMGLATPPPPATQAPTLDLPQVAQQAYLKASNAEPFDLFGASVAISGDTLVVGATDEASNATGVNGDPDNNLATTSGAAYVLVRSGSTWSQQAYLKASNTGAGDFFGGSVAISGDTIVVGAIGEDSPSTGVNGAQGDSFATLSSGAVYVFVRNGTAWSQQAYLKASGTGAQDHFGSTVSISSDTIVVGAPREDSDGTGVNGNEGNNLATDSGAAYVFVRNGTSWTQQAYLKASNAEASDGFATSVSVSGNTIVVGALGEDGASSGVGGNQGSNGSSSSGAAYVFTRAGDVWSQDAYLKASNAGMNDRFGQSVSISGDQLVISATGEDSAATGVNGAQSDNSAPESGAAYVFARVAGAWEQQAYLKASNCQAFDWFGHGVSASDDSIVVSALNEDSSATGVNGDEGNELAKDSGAAYLFTFDGSTWSQAAYLKASNTAPGDLFGGSVSISGDALVSGAARESGSAITRNRDGASGAAQWSGAAYVFGLDEFAVYCTAGVSASGCQAAIGHAGLPSATASSGFSLLASAVEGQKVGLFFFGTNGRQAAPWGNGTSYQCVVPPVARGPLTTRTGTPGQCNGSFQLDLNALWCPTCPKPASNPGASAVVQAQLWYRDPQSTSNQATSLSDAIEFTVAP